MIVQINSVKLHTDFIGPLQSVLCKMLAIGPGNYRGCSALHKEPADTFPDVIEETAPLIIGCARVGFDIAIPENACDRTFMVWAVPAEAMTAREKELVLIAKDRMAYLIFPEADVIICLLH